MYVPYIWTFIIIVLIVKTSLSSVHFCLRISLVLHKKTSETTTQGQRTPAQNRKCDVHPSTGYGGTHTEWKSESGCCLMLALLPKCMTIEGFI